MRRKAVAPEEQVNDPKGLVEGIRQALQDLLVPELKAIQATLQHHSELFRMLQEEMNRRFEEERQRTDERFAALHREISNLREDMDKRFAAFQEQMDRRFAALQQEMDRRFNEVHEVLRTILQRLDIVDVVKEIQIRQKALEEQVAYLRELLLIVFQQRGIQPPPAREGGTDDAQQDALD